MKPAVRLWLPFLLALLPIACRAPGEGDGRAAQSWWQWVQEAKFPQMERRAPAGFDLSEWAIEERESDVLTDFFRQARLADWPGGVVIDRRSLEVSSIIWSYNYVRQRYRSGPLSAAECEDMFHAVAGILPGIDRKAVDNLFRHRWFPARIELDGDRLPDITWFSSPVPSWRLFPLADYPEWQRLGEEERRNGLVCFSRVGFSAAGDEAFFICVVRDDRWPPVACYCRAIRDGERWRTVAASYRLLVSPPRVHFDFVRYQGLWYEIARLDNWFERGLTDTSLRITRSGEGEFSVTSRGYAAAAGEWRETRGKGGLGLQRWLYFHLPCFFPFYCGHQILALDEENYSYALVGGGHPRLLWVLAREPRLDREIVDNLLDRARELGFDLEDLIFVDQGRAAEATPAAGFR